MNTRLLIVVVVIVLLVVALPRWPYNQHWATQSYAYYPSGGLGLVLLILLVLLLLGYL